MTERVDNQHNIEKVTPRPVNTAGHALLIVFLSWLCSLVLMYTLKQSIGDAMGNWIDTVLLIIAISFLHDLIPFYVVQLLFVRRYKRCYSLSEFNALSRNCALICYFIAPLLFLVLFPSFPFLVGVTFDLASMNSLLLIGAVLYWFMLPLIRLKISLVSYWMPNKMDNLNISYPIFRHCSLLNRILHRGTENGSATNKSLFIMAYILILFVLYSASLILLTLGAKSLLIDGINAFFSGIH